MKKCIVWAAAGLVFASTGAAGAQDLMSSLDRQLPRSAAACNVAAGAVPPLPNVIEGQGSYTWEIVGSEKQTNNWAKAFMRLSSRAKVNPEDANDIAELLVSYANQKPLKWGKSKNSSTDAEMMLAYMTLNVGMLAALDFYFHEDKMTPDERRAVSDWLSGMMRQLKSSRLGKIEVDNKSYMLAVMSYAHGLATDSKASKRAAISIFKQALRDMRRDGSMPQDARRGGSAIHYTNKAVANLVTLAELAAIDGEDLYATRSGGKSLDLAINFLLRATIDPKLIAGYAAENNDGNPANSATNQDRNWARGGMAGWTRYYMRRFPNSENANIIRRVTNEWRNSEVYFFDDAVGNARCVSGAR
jgi:hypothetical protein